MSSLNSLWIKKEKLQEILKVLEAKDQTGIELTISIDNEPNAYGQNVSAFVSQSKEDREAEKPKYYVGNGRTFWTDGKISVVNVGQSKSVAAGVPVGTEESLPF